MDNTGEGIWLEDFEDQALNTPHVINGETDGSIGSTYKARFPNPGEFSIWGVDGDDGVIDGRGFEGDVWINSSNSGGPSQFMSFDFQRDEQGRLPSYVGLVLTRPITFDSQMEVGWVDSDGELIYDDSFSLKDFNRDPVTGELYENLFGGDPRLHRFVGLYHEEGIARFGLSGVSQIDHLQYGYSIPEPSTSGLCLLACSLGLIARRKVR